MSHGSKDTPPPFPARTNTRSHQHNSFALCCSISTIPNQPTIIFSVKFYIFKWYIKQTVNIYIISQLMT